MNISPVNSASIKTSPQHQNNKSKANTAFGLKYDESWFSTIHLYAKEERISFINTLKGINFKQTLTGALVTALQNAKPYLKGIYVHIRPTTIKFDGEGRAFPANPIVTFSRKPIVMKHDGLGLLSPKHPEECAEFRPKRKKMLDMNPTIEALTEFFSDPAELERKVLAKL